MKYLSLLFVLCLILITGCYNQKKKHSILVEFELSAPGLSPTDQVFITGSSLKLGNWNPGLKMMSPDDKNRWVFEIGLDSAMAIEYKYTLGSWEKEGTDKNGLPLSNFSAFITGDTTLSDEIRYWSHLTEPNYAGQITGKVDYHTEMKGTGILPRDVIVWLPPGYDKEADRSFPVLYMHDGQNIFDPATSYTRMDWQVDETCDSLIRTGSIPPLIVVGIYNTSDRTQEYGPGSKGDAYMEFIIQELKPFIDENYRTKNNREHTLVGGSSMGGLISFRLAWQYPDVFSKALCMSPAFQFRDMDYVSVVSDENGPKKDLVLYIDNGGLDLEADLQPGIDLMLEVLTSKGYEQNKDLFWVLDPKATHNEAAWAKRFPDALQILLSSK